MVSDELVKPRAPLVAPWLMEPLMANRGIYLQVLLSAVLVNLFSFVTSLFSMIVYDRIVPNNAIESLIALSIGVAIVLIFDFILRSLRGYFVDIAGHRMDEEVGAAIFRRLMDSRLVNRKGSAGATAGIVREFEALRDFFASATITALVDVPFILLFLVVIWLIGGVVVLVPLSCVPLVLLMGWLLQPSLDRLSNQGMGQGLSKQGVLVETISGIETVKSTNAGAMMARRWLSAVQSHAEISRRSRFVSQLAINFAGSLQQVAYIGVIIVGVLLIRENQLTSGGLLACSILAGRCVSPLSQIAGLLGRLSHTVNAYRQIDQLMQQAGDTRENVNYLRRPAFQGAVEFRHVSFRYPGATNRALEDVSFRVEPGERLAILGRVGSGKSTLTRLILGLYEPTDGSVLIDDTDVRQIHPDDMRQNVGSVLQDVVLLSGSIRDNITLGHPEVDDEEVLRAAKLAGVHDFVGLMPNGYDIRLADRGEGLSGGQRQAIAVARALVKSRPLILMDEPTSSMDVQSETALIGRLDQELAGRTLILVTHRSTMLRLVDRVMIMDKGRIVMHGPRDEVLRNLSQGAAAA